MNIISWIIVGLSAGVFAQVLMPKEDPKFWANTMLSAIVGGCTGLLWGAAGFTGFDFRSVGLAMFGSVILLGIYRLFSRRVA